MNKLISFFLITILWSQGSIDVTVDRTSINEGESIILTVTTKNINGDPEVIFPNIFDFKIVSGPDQSSSTNVQFINGKMTKNSTTTLAWTLVPIKSGGLIIPTLSIKIENQVFKSKVIQINVNKRGSKSKLPVSKFFIEAEVDNLNPYRGEQIILTYTLFTQVDVTSFDEQLPKFKGLWTEEIFSPKNLNLRETKKNGIKFYAATIKKIALFPTKSGEIHIDPMTAIIGVRDKQQRWNDFSLFGPPSKKFTVSTNLLELIVKPLPINNNEKKSSIVGEWDITSQVSATNLEQDEAVTFIVTIEGTGNIQTVDITNITFPNELEVFEPKIELKDSPFRDKITGKKQFEWVLIPRFSGVIYLPKVDLIFFNPIKNKWVVESTQRHKLNVIPNEKNNSSLIGLSKEEISLMAEDIRFLDETDPDFKKASRDVFSSFALTLLLLSGVILIFPRAFSYSQSKLFNSSGNMKEKRALSSALNILNFQSKSDEDIYIKIYEAIVLFINYKTGRNIVTYSNEEILQILNDHNLEILSEKFENILIKTQTNRFTPFKSSDSQKDLDAIKLLLKKADHAWK